MTIIDIESKRSVLESTKKSVLDTANLELQPIQAQIHRLEAQANQIALVATQKIANADGQLSVLAELAKEFAPKPTPPEGVDSTPAKLAELAA